jgi:hypothetical protein
MFPPFSSMVRVKGGKTEQAPVILLLCAVANGC